jgi:hypothetical protein
MKKLFFLAAVATMTLASCMNDEFIGTENSPTVANTETDAINFGFGIKNATRANSTGAEAADLLGNQFVVLGVKGSGSGADQTTVFSNYVVTWANGTAYTTESNTADWEYVGVSPMSGITSATSQTIKFWDFSTAAYDFAAFSVGKGNTIISSDPGTIPANQILATPITYAVSTPSATTTQYTLKGSREDLAECYITDMKTVDNANYKNEVELQFRSLASKARMAIYETVPGYSVQNVRFYTTDAASDGDINADLSDAAYANATLFGTNAFYESGLYTISFPTIGSTNSSNSDYNKAHVAISGSTATSTQSFGTLNYDAGKLGTTSKTATFAGSDPYYVTILPNDQTASVVLEMRVNYDLVADDGQGETITVHGAKAFVPATYTKWLPNYAYTYIFKISDNTNGWTSTDKSDPAGLYPITFDAVVLDPIAATNEQTTITTVAMPSITTYQKDHAASNDEYVAGEIYVQVMQGGSLATNLHEKSSLYSLSEAASEAEVMDALNLQASEAGGASYITGRNGLKLTSQTLTYNETAPTDKLYIPGEDGNNIEVDKGKAAKFTASTGTYYAYVYEVSDAADENVIYPVVLTGGTAPDDWSANASNVYYEDAACTDVADITYTAGTYYRKYTNLKKTLGVKVIKVQ